VSVTSAVGVKAYQTVFTDRDDRDDRPCLKETGLLALGSGHRMAARAPDPSARLIDVRITIAGRSCRTCVFPTQHSAWWRLDNCYRDQAVTNAAQLADLLNREAVPVVPPGA
jgi:hypothetical protein